MNNSKKHITMLFIFMVILFFVLEAMANGEEVIKKTIGERNVEFVVPDDYETLKKNYEAIIEVYAQAEDELVKIKDKSTSYVGSSLETIEAYKELLAVKNEEIQTLKREISLLKRDTGYKFYYGGLVGISNEFFKSENQEMRVDVTPIVSYVNTNMGFMLHAGPTLGFTAKGGEDISLGFTVGLSVHF